jgi:hypothetical protein
MRKSSGARLRFWPLPALGLILIPLAAAQSDAGLLEAATLELSSAGGRIIVSVTGVSVIAPDSHLLLSAAGRPIAWGSLDKADESLGVFRIAHPALDPDQADKLRAWVVPPDLVSALLPRWPRGAELLAEIDSLGPGDRTAWVQAGSDQGVRAGDCWWLRIGGQPAARLDVRFVGAHVSHCAVVPLASDPPVKPGAQVALWPSPADRRDGRARSAIAYLDEQVEGALVWVPAPRGVACPPEPHLDFLHNGNYVGHGLVERHDDRFWYARLIPANATAGDVGTRPVSRPTSRAVRPAARPQVGDEVVIRTRADIERRRYVARVFELTREGALVDAGEEDGLAAGQQAAVYRSGTALGTVVIRRVQSTYAVVTGPEKAAFELHPDDELRFAPLPAPTTIVGTIESVSDQTLFTAHLGRPDPPLQTPLAIQSLGRTVGVALLVTAEGSTAGGFALSCSLTTPLRAGMTLVQDTPD